jgi:hypothetical protein
MKTENPVLVSEYGAPKGTIIELGGKRYSSVDVTASGDLEVVVVNAEGKPDISLGVKIIPGDIQINPHNTK